MGERDGVEAGGGEAASAGSDDGVAVGRESGEQGAGSGEDGESGDVGDFGLLDEFGHTGAGPKIGGESSRLSSLEQMLFQALTLAGRQFGRPAAGRNRLQRRAAATAQVVLPATYAAGIDVLLGKALPDAFLVGGHVSALRAGHWHVINSRSFSNCSSQATFWGVV